MFNLADNISTELYNKYNTQFKDIQCHICNQTNYILDYEMTSQENIKL